MSFDSIRFGAKNCIVAQSGGPTAAINASLAGVIAAAAADERIETIYGAIHGIQGVLAGELVDLDELVGTDSVSLENLKLCPSMYLGSCRYKLPDLNEAAKPDDTAKQALEQYSKIFATLEEHNIGYFFYIGGNDSMDTIKKLGAYGRRIGSPIRFMGIPKTIDNDLPVTDHTPGYGSASRYIATSVLEMAHDTYIYSTRSVLIVEIMGRDAGWLTAASALARTSYSSAPHLIYLPERVFHEDRFLDDVRQKLEEQNHIIVAISEGICDEKGEYISSKTSQNHGNYTDQFGHTILSGAGKYLERLVANEIGCKVRSVELNVLQRCASHLASATDLNESFRLGEIAVTGALSGRSEQMAIIRRRSDMPYMTKYEFTDIANVANMEKKVPQEWINEAGNDVTEDFIRYARPLIQGAPALQYENGIPVYLPVFHLDHNEL